MRRIRTVVGVPGEGRLAGEDVQGDLVVVSLPGWQRFIAEARFTADVAAASHIYAALAGEVVRFLRDEADGDLVLPGREVRMPDSAEAAGSDDEPGLEAPNRVVALFSAGTGRGLGQREKTRRSQPRQRGTGRSRVLPDRAPRLRDRRRPDHRGVRAVLSRGPVLLHRPGTARCVPAGDRAERGRPGWHAAHGSDARRPVSARTVQSRPAARLREQAGPGPPCARQRITSR
jgi:CRISPR-associated protein